MTAANIIVCLESSCKIIIFGKNPVNGGSPARDNIANKIITVSVGDFAQVVASLLIFVVDNIISAIINVIDWIK